MCNPAKGEYCNDYTNCPFLNVILQRSYANRTLDEIFKILAKIEGHLAEMNNNGKKN